MSVGGVGGESERSMYGMKEPVGDTPCSRAGQIIMSRLIIYAHQLERSIPDLFNYSCLDD